MQNCRVRSLAICCVLGCLLPGLMTLTAEDDVNQRKLSQLTRDLDGINIRRQEFQGDMTTSLEEQALALLAADPASRVKAKVYFELVQMYVSSRTKRPDKVVEYCAKALQCPQGVESECDLYLRWGDAILRQAAFVDDKDVRKKVLAQYLKAWALVAGKRNITKKQELLQLVVPSAEATSNEVAKYSQAWTSNNEVFLQNKLIDCSGRIAERIASLYEKQGDDVLRSHIAEMVKDKKSAESLLDAVRGVWKK